MENSSKEKSIKKNFDRWFREIFLNQFQGSVFSYFMWTLSIVFHSTHYTYADAHEIFEFVKNTKECCQRTNLKKLFMFLSFWNERFWYHFQINMKMRKQESVLLLVITSYSIIVKRLCLNDLCYFFLLLSLCDFVSSALMLLLFPFYSLFAVFRFGTFKPCKGFSFWIC